MHAALLQDEAYARVSELKSTQKAKNDEFYTNRRFSRTIREVRRAEGEATGCSGVANGRAALPAMERLWVQR